jgi:hypothetical protein
MNDQLKQEGFNETEPFIDIPRGSFDPIKTIESSTNFIGKLAQRDPQRAVWIRVLSVLFGVGLILGILPPAVIIGVNIGRTSIIILWLLAIIIGIKVIVVNLKK